MIKIIENENKDQEVIYKLYFRSKEKKQSWVEILNQTFEEINSKKLFGVKLEKLLYSEREKNQNTLIPSFIENVTQFLVSTQGIKKEGLFRISGNHDNVLSLSDKLDRNSFPTLTVPLSSSLSSSTGSNSSNNDCLTALDFTGVNPHDAAALMKKFIRELPEPLLPYSSYDELILTCGLHFIFFLPFLFLSIPFFSFFFHYTRYLFYLDFSINIERFIPSPLQSFSST